MSGDPPAEASADPRCATCGGPLDWVEDQYCCRDCGDEFDEATVAALDAS